MVKRTSALALSLISIAGASLADFTISPRPPGDACPGCPRGRLQGKHGLRYCQRCCYVARKPGAK